MSGREGDVFREFERELGMLVVIAATVARAEARAHKRRKAGRAFWRWMRPYIRMRVRQHDKVLALAARLAGDGEAGEDKR